MKSDQNQLRDHLAISLQNIDDISQNYETCIRKTSESLASGAPMSFSGTGLGISHGNNTWTSPDDFGTSLDNTGAFIQSTEPSEPSISAHDQQVPPLNSVYLFKYSYLEKTDIIDMIL